METKNANPERSSEILRLTTGHWRAIKRVATYAQDFTKMDLAKDLELRFVPMKDQTYSILISFEGLDVVHFMWQEVDGLVNVSHRIVNPLFRGQGIGSEMLYAIEQRVQRLANETQKPYHLMIETSQLSVVKMGLKRGMQLTQGQELYQKALSGALNVDEQSHVEDEGYRVEFRVSKAITPLDDRIISFRDHARQDILRVLQAA